MADSQFDSLITLARLDAKALRLLMTDNALHNAAQFHAQQAIEKSLKAVLSANDVSYPLTHNLLVLKQKLADEGAVCPINDEFLARIMPFAVEARYDEQIVASLPLETVLTTVDLVMQWVEQYRPTPDNTPAPSIR